MVFAAALPFIANTSGWIFTEVGRQPWVVQGLLQTRNAVSPTTGTGEVVISLVGYTLLYGTLAAVAGWLFFREVKEGPSRRRPRRHGERRPHARLLTTMRDYTTCNHLVRAHRGALDRLLRARGVRLRRRHAAARSLGRDEPERRRAMLHTIGPVWDGNEVWLVVAGGATFAAFPEWYATLFSGFYLALVLILAALIVRGVAFEFWGKDDTPRWRQRVGVAIVVGSAVPALLWGVAWANIVAGVPIGRDTSSPATSSTCSGPTRCSAAW